MLGRVLCAVAAALAGGCSSSVSMKVATAYVQATRPPFRTAAELREEYGKRTYPTVAPMSSSLAKKATVTDATIEGHRVLTFTPKQRPSAWHLVYLHGGSFVHELDTPHWDIIESIIDATGATVIAPVYPLAPEHHADEAQAFLDALYADLVARVGAAHVVLCGDSAGGNLALVTALHARDQKHALPARLILFAPWVDITMSNPDVKYRQLDEPMLRWWDMVEFGRWWAGDADRRAPDLSPVHANLAGLPPIDIYQGSRDILAADARLLRDRIQAAHGRVAYHETPGAFHVFMAVTFAPEAKAVYRQIGRDLGGEDGR